MSIQLDFSGEIVLVTGGATGLGFATARAFGLSGAFVGVGVIAAVALATLLSFLATPIITRLLGRIGLTIVVRVLGLILCALAVQFIAPDSFSLH